MVKTDNYKICHKCNTVMRPQTVEEAFQINGRLLKTGMLKAYVCQNCGEKVFTAKEIRAIDRMARNVRCLI